MGADERRTEAVPKLSLGQRLLTALPRLGGAATVAAEPAAEPAVKPAVKPGVKRREPPRAPDTTGPEEAAVVDGESVNDEVATTRPTGSRSPAPGEARAKETARTSTATRAKATSGMTKDELAVAIKRINDQERRIGLFVAPVGALLGIVVTVYGIHLNPPVGHKDHQSESVLILFGVVRVVLAGLVAAAALTRRRSFLGFALLFLGTSFGSPIVALPFWGIGGWLIWRAFKWQKELAAITGGERRASSGGAGAQRPDARARGRAAVEKRAKKKQPLPKGPEASKRYTPPKPTRPKPPPPPT